jgi:Predicted sugar kinase
VKRVGILVATHKVGVDNALNALVTLLESWGAEILMPKEVAQRVGRPQAVDLETLRTADLLIALGGDGCVLSAARLAAPFAVPILGIPIGWVRFPRRSGSQRDGNGTATAFGRAISFWTNGSCCK